MKRYIARVPIEIVEVDVEDRRDWSIGRRFRETARQCGTETRYLYVEVDADSEDEALSNMMSRFK